MSERTATFVPPVACARTNRETRIRRQSIQVCHGPACTRSGGGARLMATLQALAPTVDVEATGCLGQCGNNANVVLNNTRVVRANRALRTLGVAPERRAQRALQLKKSGDAAMEGDDSKRALRCYALALRALPDTARMVRGRLLCNVAVAQADLRLWPECLDSAREALRVERSDSALTRGAQACHVLGSPYTAERDEMVAEMSVAAGDAFKKWRRAWDRGQFWGNLFGGGN